MPELIAYAPLYKAFQAVQTPARMVSLGVRISAQWKGRSFYSAVVRRSGGFAMWCAGPRARAAHGPSVPASLTTEAGGHLLASLGRSGYRTRAGQCLRALFDVPGRGPLHAIGAQGTGGASAQRMPHFTTTSPRDRMPVRRALARYAQQTLSPEARVIAPAAVLRPVPCGEGAEPAGPHRRARAGEAGRSHRGRHRHLPFVPVAELLAVLRGAAGRPIRPSAARSGPPDGGHPVEPCDTTPRRPPAVRTPRKPRLVPDVSTDRTGTGACVVKFRLSGPFEVVAEDEGGHPPRTCRVSRLLAVPALQSRTAVATGTLTRELRGDNPPDGALRTPRAHVSRARRMPARVLPCPPGPRPLVTKDPGHRVDIAVEDVGIHALDALSRHVPRAPVLRRGPLPGNLRRRRRPRRPYRLCGGTADRGPRTARRNRRRTRPVPADAAPGTSVSPRRPDRAWNPPPNSSASGPAF